MLVIRHIACLLVLFLATTVGSSQENSPEFSKIDHLYKVYLNNYYNQADSVEIYLDSLEKLATKHKHFAVLANVNLQRGLGMAEQANFLQSITYYNAALKLNKQTNNSDGFAMTLLYIGLNYKDQEKYPIALSYMDSSKRMYERLNDLDGVAMLNANIASVFRSQNKVDEALELLLQNDKYYTKKQNLINLAVAKNNIGNCYKDLQKYDLAIEYFMASQVLKRKTGERKNLINTYSNLGDVFALKGDFNQAFVYFDSALFVSREQKMRVYEKDIYFDMSAAYELKGDTKNALKYFKLQAQLKDSALNEEFTNQLADMRIKYETEEKEQENLFLKQKRKIDQLTITQSNQRSYILTIFLSSAFVLLLVLIFFFINRVKTNKKLQAQNEQINKQNNTLKTLNSQLIESEEELQSANEAKGQLLSIISHDISSPIKALYNYEEALLENVKAFKTVDDFTDALVKLHKTTGDVYTMSNNLLDYAQTQQEGFVAERTEFKLSDLVADVLKLLDQQITRKKLIVQNTIDQNVRINSDQNLLYILLRNIVSNAVKFSPEGKVVRLEWKSDSNKLLISDEGEGMDNQKIQSILAGNNFHSSMGTLGEKGTGLGMKIAFNCVQKLNAKINIQSIAGNGTTFSIQL